MDSTNFEAEILAFSAHHDPWHFFSLLASSWRVLFTYLSFPFLGSSGLIGVVMDCMETIGSE